MYKKAEFIRLILLYPDTFLLWNSFVIFCFFANLSCEKKNIQFLVLIKNAFSNNENWQKMWESPEPKKGYDVIIVGGGGHGLGTAYYLLKNMELKILL